MSQLAPEIPDPHAAPRHELASALAEMVGHPDYPCLGARSVFHRDRATVHVYDELAGDGVAALLLADLREFAATIDPGRRVRLVRRDVPGARASRDEQHFERLLWSQLRALHEHGRPAMERRGCRRTPRTSTSRSAPGARRTSSSACTRRRPATRAARRLRRWCSTCTSSSRSCARPAGSRRCATRSGTATWTCRAPSTRWSADHGQDSEARQYSGRAVGPDWRAPFGSDPATIEPPAVQPARAGRRPWPEPRGIGVNRLTPQTGTGFLLRPGRRSRVVDPTGGQVSDFFCFAAHDHGEWLSNGTHHRLRQQGLLHHRRRALQQPEPADGSRSWRTPAAGTTSC